MEIRKKKSPQKIQTVSQEEQDENRFSDMCENTEKMDTKSMISFLAQYGGARYRISAKDLAEILEM